MTMKRLLLLTLALVSVAVSGCRGCRPWDRDWDRDRDHHHWRGEAPKGEGRP